MALENKDQQSLIRQLPDDLKLAQAAYLSEEDFLLALSAKVAYMLQFNSGVFFQLLYKMDVLEPKLKVALKEEHVPMAIARLILERQLEQLASRRANPATEADDKDLEW